MHDNQETALEQASSNAEPSSASGSASNGSASKSPGDHGSKEAFSQRSFDLGMAKAREQFDKLVAKRVAEGKAEVLSELGLDSAEAMEKHRAALEKAQKAVPEWERKLKTLEQEHQNTTTQLSEWKNRWFDQYRSGLAYQVAHKANVLDEAVDDLEAFLGRSLHAEGESEADSKLVFRDKEEAIDVDDKAVEKIAAYVIKRKPLWIRTSVGTTQGVSPARPAGMSGQGRPQAPASADELKDAFIQKAIKGGPKYPSV